GELRRSAESIEILRSVARDLPHVSPEVLALYEGTLACALARHGHLSLAATHQRRAFDIYSALGHQVGLRELGRRWSTAAMAETSKPAPGRGDACNPVTSTIGHIASVIQHAGRPELVARELVMLLETASCVESAKVIVRSPDGTEDTLVENGTTA